ncbi:hypothetical protein KUTeg_008999, partial [Tegillarca granosa]
MAAKKHDESIQLDIQKWLKLPVYTFSQNSVQKYNVSFQNGFFIRLTVHMILSPKRFSLSTEVRCLFQPRRSKRGKKNNPEYNAINFIERYGVFAKKKFNVGDFIADYVGDLICEDEAKKREEIYERRNHIDATMTTGRIGHMINDGIPPNSKMKKMIVNKRLHLVLFATKKIELNEEIVYDYGSGEDCWWRKLFDSSVVLGHNGQMGTKLFSKCKYVGSRIKTSVSKLFIGSEVCRSQMWKIVIFSSDNMESTKAESMNSGITDDMESANTHGIETTIPNELENNEADDMENTKINMENPVTHYIQSTKADDMDNTEIDTERPVTHYVEITKADDMENTEMDTERPVTHYVESTKADDMENTEMDTERPVTHYVESTKADDMENTEIDTERPVTHVESTKADDMENTEIDTERPVTHYVESTKADDMENTEMDTERPVTHVEITKADDMENTEIDTERPVTHVEITKADDTENTEIDTERPVTHVEITKADDTENTEMDTERPVTHVESTKADDTENTKEDMKGIEVYNVRNTKVNMESTESYMKCTKFDGIENTKADNVEDNKETDCTEYTKADTFSMSTNEDMISNKLDDMERNKEDNIESTKADMESSNSDDVVSSKLDYIESTEGDSMKRTEMQNTKANNMESTKVGGMGSTEKNMESTEANNMESTKAGDMGSTEENMESTKANSIENPKVDSMKCSKADSIECMKAGDMENSKDHQTENTKVDILESHKAKDTKRTKVKSLESTKKDIISTEVDSMESTEAVISIENTKSGSMENRGRHRMKTRVQNRKAKRKAKSSDMTTEEHTHACLVGFVNIKARIENTSWEEDNLSCMEDFDDDVKDKDYEPESDTESESMEMSDMDDIILASVNMESTKADDKNCNDEYSMENSEARVIECLQRQSMDYFRNCSYYILVTPTTNLRRHLFRKHSTEYDVAMVMKHPKRSKQREKGLEKLRHLGNFYHNCKVMELGKGELVVAKRPSKGIEVSYKDFVPCVYCKGFFVACDIWRHYKNCNFADNITIDDEECRVMSSHGTLKASRILAASVELDSTGKFAAQIFGTMRNDTISAVCKGDKIISVLGTRLFMKKGHQHLNYVRAKMREIARILIKIREHTPDQTDTLKSVLCPKRFDEVIQAIQAECKYVVSENNTTFDIPSLALKIGHTLRRCCYIKMSICIKDEDKLGENEVEQFLKLMTMEYNEKVSSIALQTLSTNKSKKPICLPLTKDILKFQSFMKEKMKCLLNKFSNRTDPMYTSSIFRELAMTVMAKIMTFNKRRSGEIARSLMSNFVDRSKKGECSEDLVNMLNSQEKKLVSRLELMKITGKRGRSVPVILAEDDVAALKILVDMNVRSEAGIIETNLEQLELAKVAKLLIAVDKGQAHKLAGKKLSEIQLDDMDGVEDISDEDDEHDAIDEEPDNPVDGDACASNGRLKEQFSKSDQCKNIGNDSSSVGKERQNIKKLQNPGKKCEHKKWNSEEKKFLMEYFRKSVISGSIVGIGKKQIEEAKDKARGLLKERTWVRGTILLGQVLIFVNYFNLNHDKLLEFSMYFDKISNLDFVNCFKHKSGLSHSN